MKIYEKTFLLFGIIFGSLLSMTTITVEATLLDTKSKPYDFIHLQTKYQKQSLDANKNYNKAIIDAQTDYDRAKVYAKQIYDNNILKANGDLQKKFNAKYTYNEMLSIAKTDFIKSFNDAKKIYDDELSKIISEYTNPIKNNL